MSSNPFVMIGNELINLNNITRIRNSVTHPGNVTIYFNGSDQSVSYSGIVNIPGSLTEVQKIINNHYNQQTKKGNQ